MTPLGDILLAQIARDGPLSLADYITACLHHPDHGYYATNDPLGAAGDFITAPEISQMFGELIGLALAQAWLDQGAPAPFVLAELGPGRGTLMADALRATARVPGFHAAMRLWLVENSPALRAIQSSTLPGAEFCASVADLPEAPLFLIANEFFDALPIRAFQRTDTGWAERLVGRDGDALRFGLGAPLAASVFGANSDAFTPGQVLETCPPGEAIASEIGRRIATHGGTGLIVDYGNAESTGTTFQAVSNHQYTDPLANPGAADLSAHVAFAPLIRAAAPAIGHGPIPQGQFLTRLGIAQRARTLARNLSGDALFQHQAAFKRLTEPSEMGTLFKVIGLVPPGAAPPPGLEPS